MVARRHVTNKLHTVYGKVKKADKTRILNQVMAATGMGRSSARRMLIGGFLPNPKDQVDQRRLRPKGFGDYSRLLLGHIWALMGFPCGKYFTVMLKIWLPKILAAGDLERPFVTESAIRQIELMSAATIDRYLNPVNKRCACARFREQSRHYFATQSDLVRPEIPPSSNPAIKPGVIEADTVAHCGATLVGEFIRTLTMTDMFTGWTENYSIRNNASKWIVQAASQLQQRFPFELRVFDSDNGSEFINPRVANWLQQHDIEQTRSRPYRKNDQATVESTNNHVVRKHAFYWRYDSAAELELLKQLWLLVSARLNFFTRTKKPVGHTTNNGRRQRIYDKPQTPWQRVKNSKLLAEQEIEIVEEHIIGINPADLTRQINLIQTQITALARDETQSVITQRQLDMASLQPSINWLNPTK
jgi:hypothetical protein